MKKTLNLGCGERTFSEYPKGYACINYDERGDLPEVDIVGDVRDLNAFSKEHFDYILASDLLEHFPIIQTQSILSVWASVLKVGGILELRVPNFKFMIEHYNMHNNMQHISS